MDKKTRLNEIIKYCEIRFDRGTALDWKHGDFVDLGREIYRDTDINISANTLKRIFGKISVVDDYLPQETTIEALQKYGGYSPAQNNPKSKVPEIGQNIVNQEAELNKTEISQITIDTNVLQENDFEAVIQNPINETFNQRYFAPEKNVTSNEKIHESKYRKTSLVFTLAVVIIALLLTIKFFKKVANVTWKIALTSTDSILPSTAEFDLQFPDTNDSLFVDFGDKSPLVYIKSKQKTITHNYFFPSVFDVALRTKQETVAKTRVYIRSNNWVGLGFHLLEDIPEHYYALPAVKTGPDSLFHIDNNQLKKFGIDTTGIYYTRLYNFQPIKLNSEVFIFETTCKNDQAKKGIYCNKMQFQIYGMNSFIRFTLVSPGCGSLVLNNVSELSFDGRRNNLSKFAIALENWNTIKLINRNKHVSLAVNGKILFDGTYQMPLGEVKGVFVEFEGTGSIKNCDLKTIDGKDLYHF